MLGWPVSVCFSESQVFPAHWMQLDVHRFRNHEKFVPDPRCKSQGQTEMKIADVSPIPQRGYLLPQIAPVHGEGNCTKDHEGHSGIHNGNQRKNDQ